MPILPQKECTGCTACMQICPAKAITMNEDSEGFLRPGVNKEQCVECGQCERYCPVSNLKKMASASKCGVYAAKVKDDQIHKRSQSGGVFYILAEKVLSQGGTVYGAALGEHFETEHIRVTTVEQLQRLQGVKYVQSRLKSVFSLVGKDLTAGVSVLFSGTPCQVAGIQAYLAAKRINTENLLTVDLVCYGVPSPGVFRAWINCLERANRSALAEMQYRRTDANWGKGKECYRFCNGKVLEGDYFNRWYFGNLIIRQSCEKCQFCNTDRPGDLTLGDFWGIENIMPDFFDDRGVSLVICNNRKARKALDREASQLDIRQCDINDAIASQPRLRNIAVKANKHRAAFWEKYHTKGMEYIAIEEGFIPASLGMRIKIKLKGLRRRKDRA